MKNFFVIFTTLFLTLLFPPPLYSQEIIDKTKKTALGVNPAIVEVIIDKEKPLTKEITLYNLTNFPLPIKTIKESFSPKEKLEIPQRELERFDASSWIKIEEKDRDFILQPREIKKIKLMITSPVKASPGGHYASVVFEPLIPQEIISRESVYIFARVAVLVFIQVKGDVVENLEFKTIKVEKIYQNQPEKLTLVLKNTGNTHLRPTGRLIFYDEWRQKTIGQVAFLPSIILPQTEKEYPVELFDNIGLPLGKLSVRAEITYGVDNRALKSPKFYFFIFPYNLFIFTTSTIVIFVILGFKLRKRLIKALKILIYDEKKDKKDKNITHTKKKKVRLRLYIESKRNLIKKL